MLHLLTWANQEDEEARSTTSSSPPNQQMFLFFWICRVREKKGQKGWATSWLAALTTTTTTTTILLSWLRVLITVFFFFLGERGSGKKYFPSAVGKRKTIECGAAAGMDRVICYRAWTWQRRSRRRREEKMRILNFRWLKGSHSESRSLLLVQQGNIKSKQPTNNSCLGLETMPADG